MIAKNGLLVISLFILLNECVAQEKSSVKFGEVSEKDLATKIYAIDSNANAVVIADIGSTKLEGNSKGWFSLVYKRYRRVHILNKNGYDAANIAVRLYTEGRDEESLDKIKAVTYNLENGKVVQTKLDTKSGVFKEKLDNNRIIKKITLPNVKEGSIIEYEYTITSDFLFNLQPWSFQGGYPCLWSEYKLSVPDFFRYVFLTQGYKGFDINERKDKREIFMVVDHKSQYKDNAVNIESNVSDFRWVIKNVPALKSEAFTNTIENHVTKVEFQLSEQTEPLQPRRVLGSWPEVTQQMMGDKDFGLLLTEDNYWLNETVSPLVKDAVTPKEKAQKIYAYLRDNFTCTNRNRITIDQTLRNIVKSRNGTEAELNLLLIAMLKIVDINADPVILSTRTNGNTYYGYPVLSQYNYVIARANVGGSFYYLDATEPRLAFGRLPLYCYNSFARVINKAADPVDMKSIPVNEVKYSTVFISADEKGKISGTMQQSPGYYESLRLRNSIKEKGQAEVQNEIIKRIISPGTEIKNLIIDSLDKYESGLSIKYNFETGGDNENIIYLNPYFGEGLNDNPFKSAERVYPVEMPYTIDQTHNFQMEIPAGYMVDELPKPMTLKLNDKSEAKFEYAISQAGNIISFRSRLLFTRSYFMPNEYQVLRQFFDMVVKKQAEQLVLKRKK